MTSAQRRRIRKYAKEHGITFEEACRRLGVKTAKDGATLRWFEGLKASDQSSLVVDAFEAARAKGAWNQALALGKQNKTLAIHTTVYEDKAEKSLVIHVKMPKDGNEAAIRHLLDKVRDGEVEFQSSIAFEGELAVPAMFADGAYEEGGKYYMLGVRDMGMDAILFRVECFDGKPDLVS